MKDIYEIGIVFRGTILVNHHFNDLPGLKKEKLEPHKDLRGSFISAISSFVSKSFKNNALEYLESGKFLFTFRIGEIKAKDSDFKEPIIIYGLIGKSKKNPDKLVKLFIKKIDPILTLFINRYENSSFLEISQFEQFEYDLVGILL